MIVLMKYKQLKKNHKKLGKCGEFYIVDATTQPKMKDYHNILTENVIIGATSLSTTVNGLAFDPVKTIFDDTAPLSRREELRNKFFTNSDFIAEFMVVLSLQIAKPNDNIFICLEDDAYDNMALEFIERFKEILGMNTKGLIYIWNDTAGMREYLERYIDKNIESYEHKRDDNIFDKDSRRDRNFRDDDFGRKFDLFDDDDDDIFNDRKHSKKFKTSSLDDDTNDIYTDYIELKGELENMETNKELRMAFLTYAKPSKNKLEKVSAVIERYNKSRTLPD